MHLMMLIALIGHMLFMTSPLHAQAMNESEWHHTQVTAKTATSSIQPTAGGDNLRSADTPSLPADHSLDCGRDDTVLTTRLSVAPLLTMIFQSVGEPRVINPTYGNDLGGLANGPPCSTDPQALLQVFRN